MIAVYNAGVTVAMQSPYREIPRVMGAPDSPLRGWVKQSAITGLIIVAFLFLQPLRLPSEGLFSR
jgi:hypothetical protein